MPEIDSFLDTNILLYAVSTAPAEAEKTRVARDLTQTANWAWSAISSRCVRNIDPTPPISSIRLTSGAVNRGESTRTLRPCPSGRTIR